MTWNSNGSCAQDGDLVQLVGLNHKHFLVRLQAGGEFQSHRGVLKHDEMIGKPWGSQIQSHMGSPFFLIQPSLADVLRELKRNTQILYPKDIGFILVTMGIGPGQHILEAGTGSGSLTSAFSFAVGPQGHVTTYEVRPQMQELARRNLTQLGLIDRVTMKLGDVSQGFEETGVDALFLDLPNPFDYIHHVRAALKPGGFFGTILPTANQVIKLLIALRQNRFAFVDVCEVLLRYYKAESSRFRPTDRMVAHTGFLIFARPVVIQDTSQNFALLREAGLVGEEDEPVLTLDPTISEDLNSLPVEAVPGEGEAVTGLEM